LKLRSVNTKLNDQVTNHSLMVATENGELHFEHKIFNKFVDDMIAAYIYLY